MRKVSSERVSDASWLEAAAIYFENRPTNGEDADHWANVANAERCRSIAAALRSSVKTVEVKPLEWARGWMNAEAQTEIGRYEITYRRDGSFEWSIGCLKEWASSWDAAKSAAQADYERRIFSAIEE